MENDIIDLTNKADNEIDQIKKDYNPRIKSLNENEEKMILTNSNKRNEEIPKIEKETDKINSEITKAKDEKRIKAQRSSVYRFAAWYYSVPDIVDVKKEQLDFVAFIWFGSIALVAATMGTILALIHYIVDDPENYKPRQKINFRKRIIVTLLLFIRRITHLVKSLIKMLLSFSRLILSFAEIFRGLIGKPIQRSFRNLFVAFRKRLNKPKIKIEEKIIEKEVKVEVEKPVEKEVIKEVEVVREVPVDRVEIKEVEVVREVPVDRVEIKEVPKEIVRKELVYVPLYSTEGGLVNAPESVRKNKDSK